MNGYVAQRRGRFYAVIYEGLDPVTGRERRTVASRRHRPGRGRTARDPARRRGARTGRRGAGADLRRLPDRPVAAGQEAAARDQHLPGLRTQRAPPHPPRARTHRTAPAPPPPHRSALRPAPHPNRRAAGPRPEDGLRDPPRDPRRPRRSRTSRAAHPQRRPDRPLPQAEGDPEDRSPVLDRRPAAGSSCGPQPVTGSSRCCGSPP